MESGKDILRVLAPVLALLSVAACTTEEEPSREGAPAARQQTVVGVVATIEGDGGEIEGVTLAAKSGAVYQITLDAKGNTLGRDMDGARVEVTGSVSARDGQKWLTVTSYKLPEPAEPEEAEGVGGTEETEPPAPAEGEKREEEGF